MVWNPTLLMPLLLQKWSASLMWYVGVKMKGRRRGDEGDRGWRSERKEGKKEGRTTEAESNGGS